MSLFNIKTAKQNAIIAQPHVKEVEKIFDKYVRTTLEKIEISISDARGRYEQGKTYASAKRSQNWKVAKKADSLEGEEVKVWLKIGVKKQGIFTNQEGVEVLEAKIPSTALLATLLDFKQSVEFVRDNPESKVAKEFWKEAIDAAKPKSKPKAQGMNDWEYDVESDSYVPIP